MGEYHCEGIGSVDGGTYDKLHVEGVFTSNGPIKANQVIGEGVMNFSGLCAGILTLEGVTNVKGLLEAENCNAEGVLNAKQITIFGNLYSDGVVHADYVKAGSATLLHNSKKEIPRPFTKIRSFFSGSMEQEDRNSKIREISADTLVIQDYSVKKITGKDITIGKGCIVDEVIADTKLRIHCTAKVASLGGSVMPEYFE